MWTVDKPSMNGGSVYGECISRVRITALKNRLKSIAPQVAIANTQYEQHGQNETLHLVQPTNGIGGVVSTKEMVAVYDQRMVAKGAPGRAIYDRLKMLPEEDRCPFCNQRSVSTLDHFLPKGSYPILAVAPLNLVGSCMECNKAKKSYVPGNADEVYLHPYFDDLGEDTWLSAEVVQQSPCGFKYQVLRPAHWSDRTFERAKKQFKDLGLSRLYSVEAARELSNIRHGLAQHHAFGGLNAVRSELTRQWGSRRVNWLNSWQTAFYFATAADDWFCDQGFRVGA